jgi:hypothetical protein
MSTPFPKSASAAVVAAATAVVWSGSIDERAADEAARRGITVAPRAIPTAAEGER